VELWNHVQKKNRGTPIALFCFICIENMHTPSNFYSIIRNKHSVGMRQRSNGAQRNALWFVGVVAMILLMVEAASQPSHHQQQQQVPASLSNDLRVLPLLPHHQVVRRRRLEKQQQEEGSFENDLGVVDDFQMDALFQGFGVRLLTGGNDSRCGKDCTAVLTKSAFFIWFFFFFFLSLWLFDHLFLSFFRSMYQTHYVDLWVGCPPQRQTVIVDTGSGVTAFPCFGCEECGAASTNDTEPHPDDGHHNHIDGLYMQNESACFQYTYCDADRDCHMGNCPRGTGGSSTLIGGDFGGGDYGGNDASALPPFFDPNGGAGGGPSTNVCRISMAYAEGSAWYALEATDRAYAGGSHFAVDVSEAQHSEQFQLRFGCQMVVMGLFEEQLEDGIMGMMNSPSSYWSQLQQAGYIKRAQFSLCYTENPVITYSGTDAGAMVLGGTDQRLHSTPMVFAQASSYLEGPYQVTLEQVLLRMHGGESIVTTASAGEKETKKRKVIWKTVGEGALPAVNAIVDSGSTSTHLGYDFLEPFQRAFKELTGFEYDAEKEYQFDFDGTDATASEQLAELLPTIVFQLQAADGGAYNPMGAPPEFEGFANDGVSIRVVLPPSSYMHYYKSIAAYKMKLLFRDAAGWGLVSLGASFLMGKDVLFDVENNRIGFAESSCDYLSILGDQRFNHSMEAEIDAYLRTHPNASISISGTNDNDNNNANDNGDGSSEHGDVDVVSSSEGGESDGIVSEAVAIFKSIPLSYLAAAIALVAVVVVAMVVVGRRNHGCRYDALAPREPRAGAALDHDDDEVPDFEPYFDET